VVKVCLIIPAGGSGKRMNTPRPKTLLELQGMPIIYWTIRRFCQVVAIKQIVIPVHLDWKVELEQAAKQAIIDSNRLDIVLDIVSGGNERIHSIANAIEKIDPSLVSLVAVHDAVRPFVSKKTIQKCIDMAQSHRAVIPGLPLRETIKKITSDFKVQETPNRSEYWSVQTPQVFHVDLFKMAYQNAQISTYFGTDDASVIEFLGVDVHFCEGNDENIKITYPIDFELAQLLINKQNYD
jgi:2-C-methyl-D-erythritol 4-phosphate cytidylyltransferase